MKKLKKILSLMACFAMLMVSSFTLTACSKEEVAENTETVIETSSSIIPVELSKETAVGMLSTAFRNFHHAKSYSISCFANQENYGKISMTETGLLTDDGDRFVHQYLVGAEYGDGGAEMYGTYKEGDNTIYALLDLKNKTYQIYDKPVSRLTEMFVKSFEYVTSARYYQGSYFVTAIVSVEQEAEQSEDPGSGGAGAGIITLASKEFASYEFEIKDGFIVSVSETLLSGKAEALKDVVLELNATAKYTIRYTDIDTSMIVTSLDGFTKRNI